MGNKKGRPKKEDNKVFGYRLRLTKDEYERLDNLSKKTGETKIDLLLEGFKMVEKLKKNSIERRLIGYPKNRLKGVINEGIIGYTIIPVRSRNY